MIQIIKIGIWQSEERYSTFRRRKAKAATSKVRVTGLALELADFTAPIALKLIKGKSF